MKPHDSTRKLISERQRGDKLQTDLALAEQVIRDALAFHAAGMPAQARRLLNSYAFKVTKC